MLTFPPPFSSHPRFHQSGIASRLSVSSVKTFIHNFRCNTSPCPESTHYQQDELCEENLCLAFYWNNCSIPVYCKSLRKPQELLPGFWYDEFYLQFRKTCYIQPLKTAHTHTVFVSDIAKLCNYPKTFTLFFYNILYT